MKLKIILFISIFGSALSDELSCEDDEIFGHICKLEYCGTAEAEKLCEKSCGLCTG